MFLNTTLKRSNFYKSVVKQITYLRRLKAKNYTNYTYYTYIIYYIYRVRQYNIKKYVELKKV